MSVHRHHPRLSTRLLSNLFLLLAVTLVLGVASLHRPAASGRLPATQATGTRPSTDACLHWLRKTFVEPYRLGWNQACEELYAWRAGVEAGLAAVVRKLVLPDPGQPLYLWSSFHFK